MPATEQDLARTLQASAPSAPRLLDGDFFVRLWKDRPSPIFRAACDVACITPSACQFACRQGREHRRATSM